MAYLRKLVIKQTLKVKTTYTSRKTKLYARKAHKREFELSTKQSTSGCSSNALQPIPDEVSISPAHSTSEDEYELSPTVTIYKVYLTSLAIAADRSGVSDRTAALLASATLHDHRIITTNDSSKVID